MSSIRLISTDFDGTMFAEFEQPPVPLDLQRQLEEVQAQGIFWVINTGRDMSGLMECLGRAHLRIRPDYLVLVEREIYRHDGARYLPVEPWNQVCHQQHQELFQRLMPRLPTLLEWINDRFEATIYEDPYSPFCLIAGNNDDADQIMHYLDDFCRSIPNLAVMRNDVYARFCHASYSKGTALAELGRLLGIGPAEILAAGDHLNDLPMLSRTFAHHLVAPGNAIPEVRAAVRSQGGHVSRARFGAGLLEGIRTQLRGAQDLPDRASEVQ